MRERESKVKKLAVVASFLAPSVLFAQSNMDQVITSVSDYKDDAILVGVAVLLFVIGRKVVRKLI